MRFGERLPYPGLRAYSRDETDLFFGREGCVDEMIDRLAKTRFLAVLGASGSGKSSLVRTGLLDGLEIGLYAEAGASWMVADLHPGGRPLANLASALLRAQDCSDETARDANTLEAFLRRGPRSIMEWVRDGNLPVRTNLLILVDQFEELFRYGDYAGREEAEAFVALLLEAAASPEAIHVVITMRSEYLGACALIPGLAEQINRSLYLTRRMTREECRAAIEGPAAVTGFDIESRLVTRLLNDLASFAPWDTDRESSQLQRLSRQADQLPLMQHALSRLWQIARRQQHERRPILSLKDYLAIGEIEGAVDRHADAVFAGLREPAHAIVPRVFRALVAGTSLSDAIRRPARFDELAAVVGAEPALVAEVVDAFRAHDCNFLRPGGEEPLTDDAVVDISHESLIRQWRNLADWFADEARAVGQWSRLITAEALHRAGEGELWKGLDLANALAWRDRQKPTQAWADAHGGRFDEVESFLRRSHESDEAERRAATERIEKEQRDLRRVNRTLAAGATICMVLLLGMAVVYARLRVTERSLTEQTTELIENKTKLEKRNGQYLAQTKQAEAATRDAESAKSAAQRALRRAEEEADRAIEANARSLTAAETFVVGFAEQLRLTPGVSKDFIDQRIKDGRAFIDKLDSRMRDKKRLAFIRAKFAIAAASVLTDRGDPEGSLSILSEAEHAYASHSTAELTREEIYRLVELRYKTSEQLTDLQRFEDAKKKSQEAIDLLNEHSDITTIGGQMPRAWAEFQLGLAQVFAGNDNEGTEAARTCLNVIESSDQDRNSEFYFAKMSCHYLLSVSADHRRQYEESVSEANLAKSAFDLIDLRSYSASVILRSAEVFSIVGNGLFDQNKYSEATGIFLRFNELMQKVAWEEKFPELLQVRFKLSYSQMRIGDGFKFQNKDKEATEWYEASFATSALNEYWRKDLHFAETFEAIANKLSGSLLGTLSDPVGLSKSNQVVTELIKAREFLMSNNQINGCYSCTLENKLTLMRIAIQLQNSERKDSFDQTLKISDEIASEAKHILQQPRTQYDAVNARRYWFFASFYLPSLYDSSLRDPSVADKVRRLESVRDRLREFAQAFPQSWRTKKMLGLTLVKLAKLHEQAFRSELAIATATEAADLLDPDAMEMLEHWYRKGFGAISQDPKKADAYKTKMAARNWTMKTFPVSGSENLGTDSGQAFTYNVVMFDASSPLDDNVRSIVAQVEEIEGVRLTDSAKSFMRSASEVSRKFRNISYVDLMTYIVSNYASSKDLSAEKISAEMKDRLAVSDLPMIECSLKRWWSSEQNRKILQDGLEKLVDQGISPFQLRDTALEQRKIAEAAQDLSNVESVAFASERDSRCVRSASLQPTTASGTSLLAQIADHLSEAGNHEIAGVVADALLSRASLEPVATASLMYLQGQAHANAKPKRLEQAEASYVLALTFHPDDPKILAALGQAYVEHDYRIRPAIELLQRAVKFKPEDVQIRYRLGWAYVKSGDFDNGLKLIQAAAAAAPGNAEILAHLAELYRQLSRYNEAKAIFVRADALVRDDPDVAAFIDSQTALVDFEIAKQLSREEKNETVAAAAALLKNLDASGLSGISTDDAGIALRGYDVVAYHLQNRAAIGSIRFSVPWKRALWLFATAETQALFQEAPERYIPAFGGFCAACIASNHKRHGDPSVWKIYQGKLYLHSNRDLRDDWSKYPDVFIKLADEKWPELEGKAVDPDVRSPVSDRLLAKAGGLNAPEAATRTRAEILGSEAFAALKRTDFAKALSLSDDAIALQPDLVWLYGNRANALMMLGRVEEARAIYLGYRGRNIGLDDGRPWEKAVMDDFAEFRKRGITHPLMNEIERAFGS